MRHPRSPRPLLLALALTALGRGAAAQDETLLHGGAGSVGFYVAPVVKLTEISGRGEAMDGLRAGVLFDRRFGVGLAVYSGGEAPYAYPAYLSVAPPPGYGRPGEPALTYGGLELEYLWQPSKLVHATVTTLVGGGSLATEMYYGLRAPVPLDTGMARWDAWDATPREQVFVAEPAAHVEVNLVKHVRLGVGLGYRFTAGGDRYSSAASNARGATGTLTLRFGKL